MCNDRLQPSFFLSFILGLGLDSFHLAAFFPFSRPTSAVASTGQQYLHLCHFLDFDHDDSCILYLIFQHTMLSSLFSPSFLTVYSREDPGLWHDLNRLDKTDFR